MKELESTVPSYIERITPKVIPISLEPFSINGELFAEDSVMEKFVLETWRRWIDIPDGYDTSPHIFVMDFSSVTEVKPDSVQDGFTMILANCKGKSSNAYVVLDNLKDGLSETSPYQVFSSEIQKLRSKPLVAARVLGEEKYSLIGSPSKVASFGRIFEALTEEKGWIRGIDLLTKLSLPSYDQKSPSSWKLLNMSHEGVILDAASSDGSYYRSLV